MSTFHFTLIVDGPDLQDRSLIDSLFEAGCDDATIGCSDGVQYVDFDREAENINDAILSAVDDLEKLDGVEVVRITDLRHGTGILTQSGGGDGQESR